MNKGEEHKKQEEEAAPPTLCLCGRGEPRQGKYPKSVSRGMDSEAWQEIGLDVHACKSTAPTASCRLSRALKWPPCESD